jgi:hypothetical protein
MTLNNFIFWQFLLNYIFKNILMKFSTENNEFLQTSQGETKSTVFWTGLTNFSQSFLGLSVLIFCNYFVILHCWLITVFAIIRKIVIMQKITVRYTKMILR